MILEGSLTLQHLSSRLDLIFSPFINRTLVVKNLHDNAGDVRDVGFIPGLGRCPGGGHGNPLQYTCLENPMDRGAWSPEEPYSS